MSTRTTGNLGERLAASYLRRKGYKILATNYFLLANHGPKVAEIDIIAKKAGIFVFVEVKTIKANSKFLAQDKVNEMKKWKIAKAAEMWLIKNNIPLNAKWQIDVIAIELLPDTRQPLLQKLLGPKHKLSHFENISLY